MENSEIYKPILEDARSVSLGANGTTECHPPVILGVLYAGEEAMIPKGLASLTSNLYTDTMADSIDSVVLENPTREVNREEGEQKPEEFVSPTPEERRRELAEVSKSVRGTVEYVSREGKSIMFGQQEHGIHRPKSAAPVAVIERGTNKINHQSNVALLRNTYHNGVWYDSGGTARPRKK